MKKIIDSCEPDCPKRSGECHATCERYKKAREKRAEEKAKHSYNIADVYRFDQLKAKKISVAQSQKKNKPYKGRVVNFK